MNDTGLEASLSDAYLTLHPVDAARSLEHMPPDHLRDICRSSAPSRVAPVLAQMDPVTMAALLTDLDLNLAISLVTELPAQDACPLLRRLDSEKRDALLAALPTSLGSAISESLAYPDDQAGAMLDPTVLTLWADQTVEDALTSVSRAGPRAHTYLFVIERRRILVGVVDLRKLLIADPSAILGGIARRDVARIRADADRTDILAHPAWSDFHALPVVDDTGRFLGILRHETLRRLETGPAEKASSQVALALAVELGELGWSIGCTALDEVSSMVTRVPGDGEAAT